MKPIKGFLNIGILSVSILLAAWPIDSAPLKPFRKISQHAFGPGEKIVFDMGWKAATAGSATIEVGKQLLRQNRTAQQVSCVLTTNAVIDAVFIVRDQIQSWIDVDSIMSLGYAEQLNEGGKLRNRTVFISPVKGTFSSRSVRPSKGQKVELEEGSCPPYVQDPLSALFFVRTQDFKVGSDIKLSVLNNGKISDIALKIIGLENVKVPAGKYDAFKCELLLRTEKGFERHEKGSLFVWFSNDARHVPVKISAELPFGSVSADLVSYSPPHS